MTNSTGFPTIDVYQFICHWALAHKGNTPSQRQIAEGCGFSGATAHYHIHALMDQGLLQRIDKELCVARIEAVASPNIFDMMSVERVYPDIELMEHIPKDISKIGPSLSIKNLKVELGDVVDEEFMKALYPKGWKFIKVSTDEDNLRDTYLLLDERGNARATLNFDRLNYKANIIFWR